MFFGRIYETFLAVNRKNAIVIEGRYSENAVKKAAVKRGMAVYYIEHSPQNNRQTGSITSVRQTRSLTHSICLTDEYFVAYA